MRNISANGYKRITKRAAARLYERGQPVLFCPVNLIPGGAWGNGCIVTKEGGETFEQVLNAFEYYNCCNNETGYYAAFYVEE
jgi:hypothetical protein